jgi:hypothetical protein
MSWVAKNTTIPIPDVVAYDASTNNPIAHEYTLLSRADGVTLSEIYHGLDEEQLGQILDQLAGFLTQLHTPSWDAIGGLTLDKRGEAVVGRVVDETFWQAGDVEKLWPEGETVESLNIRGPYSSYVDFVSGQVRQYLRLIQLHEKLAFMRDVTPRLEAFLAALPQHADELNRGPLWLAHKDLHFANMLYDATSGKITAILDWEFSGIVPAVQWDPRRSFLWNGRDTADGVKERQRVLEVFGQRCKQSGAALLDDAVHSSPLQKAMQDVADFLRAIVEVVPRDQRKELVPKWRETVLENVARFGI